LRKVGNGLKTSFWRDVWHGSRSFAQKYPRLFLISSQKEALVGEVGGCREEGVFWNLS